MDDLLETKLNDTEKEMAEKFLGLSENGMPMFLYNMTEKERCEFFTNFKNIQRKEERKYIILSSIILLFVLCLIIWVFYNL